MLLELIFLKNSYQSYFNGKTSFFGLDMIVPGMFNALVNLILSIARLVVDVASFTIDFLEKDILINGIKNNIVSTLGKVTEKFLNDFKLIAFSILLVMVVLSFLMGSVQKIIKLLITFVLIFGCLVVVSKNSNEIVDNTFSLLNDTRDRVIKIYDKEDNNISLGDKLFLDAYRRPWTMLIFDKYIPYTESEDVSIESGLFWDDTLKKNIKEDTATSRPIVVSDFLIDRRWGSEKIKKAYKDISDLSNEIELNSFSAFNVIMRIPNSILLLCNVIIVSIFTLSNSIFMFLIKVFILMFFMLSPFAMILALIPQFSHIVKTIFSKIVVCFIQVVVLSLFFMFVYNVFKLIDLYINVNNFIGFATVVLLKYIIVKLLLKYKDDILGIFNVKFIKYNNTKNQLKEKILQAKTEGKKDISKFKNGFIKGYQGSKKIKDKSISSYKNIKGLKFNKEKENKPKDKIQEIVKMTPESIEKKKKIQEHEKKEQELKNNYPMQYIINSLPKEKKEEVKKEKPKKEEKEIFKKEKYKKRKELKKRKVQKNIFSKKDK